MTLPGYYNLFTGTGGPTSYATAAFRLYYTPLTYQRPNIKVVGIPNTAGGYIPFGVATWPSGLGILLKRTSATNYMLARWHAGVQGPGSGGFSQHELEIVVNTGSGEVVSAFADRGTPFSQLAQLISWLDVNNVVHAQVIDVNSSGIGNYTPLISTSYQLTAPQITALGAGVSGASGVVYILGFNSRVSGKYSSGGICKYTSRRDDIALASSSAVVLGDVDTPPRLRLGGDTVNPVVTISTPDGGSSTLQFIDTFTQTNPAFIDFDQGTIIDSTGANRFGGVQSGSSMRNLQPGVNTVTIQAENWTSSVQHAIVWWRDAHK